MDASWVWSNMSNWRPIKDFPMYEVSDTGLVRSHHRTRTGKRGGLLALYLRTFPNNSQRRYQVNLCGGPGTRQKKRDVAQLVLETFVGPRPEGMECCHEDGDSLNNELPNLRWDTHYANMQDAVGHGVMGRPCTHSAEMVREIFKAEGPQEDIGERFGVTGSFVCEVKSRKTRGDLTKDLGKPGPNTSPRKSCVFTREQILQIHKEATAEGASLVRVLAKKYGVGITTIKRIRAGKFPVSMNL